MTNEVKVLSDKQLEEIRFDIKNTKPTSSLQGLFRQHCETLLAENTALREQSNPCHADAEEDLASARLRIDELKDQLAHWQERTRERTGEVERLQSELAQITRERQPCLQVQKRGIHSSVTCPCVIAMEASNESPQP